MKNWITISIIFLFTTICLAQKEPKINGLVRSSIFIFDATINPCDSSVMHTPLGSGFLVSMRALDNKNDSLIFTFLVTCQHVIEKKDSIIIRYNNSQSTEFACTKITFSNQKIFKSLRPEVDLVAISFSPPSNRAGGKFDFSLILDEKSLKETDITIGHDVLTIGYMYGYSGIKKNYPIAKFGKIAMLTSEKWYRVLPLRNKFEEGYLIELQNTPGLSGAPVIIQGLEIGLTSDKQLHYRELSPLIFGVVKGLLLSPVGPNNVISQGVAVVEPGKNLIELFEKGIVPELTKEGYRVLLER